MTDCQPDATETRCIRCGWEKPARIVGWPHRNCRPLSEEEIAARQAICLGCEHHDPAKACAKDGIKSTAIAIRQTDLARRQRHGHCCLTCCGAAGKW